VLPRSARFDFSAFFSLEVHYAFLRLVSDHSGELGRGGDIKTALEMARQAAAGV
jgi:hypothetical protein